MLYFGQRMRQGTRKRHALSVASTKYQCKPHFLSLINTAYLTAAHHASHLQTYLTEQRIYFCCISFCHTCQPVHLAASPTLIPHQNNRAGATFLCFRGTRRGLLLTGLGCASVEGRNNFPSLRTGITPALVTKSNFTSLYYLSAETEREHQRWFLCRLSDYLLSRLYHNECLRAHLPAQHWVKEL